MGWSPQPGPQKALIDCPIYEVFFGGARGGGKTDGVLGKYAIKERMYGRSFNAVFFRQELPMLDDAIQRSKDIYYPLGAAYNEQKKQWLMPNGGRLRFRPLESVKEAQKFQGQNLTDACIEEAGTFADDRAIRRIHGAIRSAHGVPTQMLLTGNPGGPGQGWIKERYIDPAPGGMQVLEEVFAGGFSKKRVFIPSRLENNKILLAKDPEYIATLHLVGSKQLVKAWLGGDWGAVEGAYFDCWSDKLVLAPFKIPETWSKFRSFDWGSARPFSVGWWAIAAGDAHNIPRGALVRYREWYGSKSPNVGIKLTAESVADGIIQREHGKKFGVADPSIFSEDGGPSIAERMGSRGIFFNPADNKRVGRKGHMGGWDQMRQRIIGEDGKPMIYCFSTCADSIRTIPSLQHDELNPEDLDTKSEDHAADEWRYACMSRPYIPAVAQKQTKQPDRWARAFNKEDANSWKTI